MESMKKFNVIVSVLLLLVLLNFGCLSATTWTRAIDYENNDLDVVFKNWWGLGQEQGRVELKSHPTIEYVKPMGLGWGVTMYYDFKFNEDLTDVLGEVEFINMKNNKPIEREWKYVYWFEETREREICSTYSKTETKNGTIEECSAYELEKYTHGEWKDYNSKDIPKKSIRIGIMVNNKEGDYVDGIWNIGSKRLDRHATWTASLEAGLLAYYKLDETSGTTANDEVGSNDGTIDGATINQDGKIGRAYSFDGTNDKINITHNSSLSLTNAITLSVWVNFNDLDTDFGIIDKNGVMRLWRLGMNNNIYFDAPETSLRINEAIPSIAIGTWYHLVVTYDKDAGANNCILYVNGNAVKTITDTDAMGTNTNDITIGKVHFETPIYANGLLDEIGIWSRALSSSEVETLYNNGDGLTYKQVIQFNINLIAPANDTTLNYPDIDFETEIETTLNVTNVSLVINDVIEQTNVSGLNGTYTFTETLTDGTYNWSIRSSNDLGNTTISEYRTLFIDTTQPSINVTSLLTSYDYLYNNQSIDLNYSISDINLESCWYNYNSVNTTLNCSTNDSFYYTAGVNSLIVYANDSAGNINQEEIEWEVKIFEINVNYLNEVVEGELQTIMANLTLNSTPSKIQINYSGTLYSPIISTSGNNYSLTNTISSPQVDSDENKSFYYIITIDGTNITTRIFNQTIKDLIVSETCGAGNFPFLTFTNYNEKTELTMSATVEYEIGLYNQNILLGYTNGSATGISKNLCSNINLSNSGGEYDLSIRHYADGFVYKSYNKEQSEVSELPVNISLYNLNESLATEFIIDYQDYDYIQHPGALIQIHRKYLDKNKVNIVEIPIITNDGTAKGYFDTNNIEYSLIIIKDGEILDTFTKLFPKCQNIILGTCKINVIGTTSNLEYYEGEDFTYSVQKDDTSIILTYAIPSGTPSNVKIKTNQTSKYLSQISYCSEESFSSGGILTCNYNKTLGDSYVKVQIIKDDEINFEGMSYIPEDLGNFFMLNNFFIGFILLTLLSLMFISSGALMVVSVTIGILYLGMIFLLDSSKMSFTFAGSSLLWLIIAGIILIFKLSQKEERV